MPGLSLTQVSSNWKKLQEKLQTERPAQTSQNGLKRKRPDNKHGKVVKPSKRARISDTDAASTNARRGMGMFASRPEGIQSEDATHADLAERHGISRQDISAAYGSQSGTARSFTDDINGGLHPTHKVGKYVALDCEMVGTGAPPYDDDVLARVSLVNFHGEQIYDTYVLPPAGVKIEEYRTFVSGIKPSHLLKGYARPLQEVQKAVADLLHDRILVGHALRKDLTVLLLSHPKRDMRDTSRYPPFKALNYGRPPALRHLAKVKLGAEIQTGEHSSIEDARAAMMLFTLEKAGFEEENRKRFGVRARLNGKGGKAGRAGQRDEEDEQDEEDGDSEEDDVKFLDGEEEIDWGDGQTKVEKRPKSTAKKRKTKKRTKRK